MYARPPNGGTLSTHPEKEVWERLMGWGMGVLPPLPSFRQENSLCGIAYQVWRNIKWQNHSPGEFL